MCKGINKNGTPCKMSTPDNGYCWRHLSQYTNIDTEKSCINTQLKLVIFDLDDTLMHSPDNVHGILVLYLSRLANHARYILDYLYFNDIKLALATHNTGSHIFIKFHKIRDYFAYHCSTTSEMRKAPSATMSKQWMFEHIRQQSGIDYCNMLFFDNLPLNVNTAKRLGIKAVCVNDALGITLADLEKGLSLFNIPKNCD